MRGTQNDKREERYRNEGKRGRKKYGASEKREEEQVQVSNVKARNKVRQKRKGTRTGYK